MHIDAAMEDVQYVDYVSYDDTESSNVYDNSHIEFDANRIIQKKKQPAVVWLKVQRLPPPRQVKCPRDLTSITL
jgi:hypothetical protein